MRVASRVARSGRGPIAAVVVTVVALAGLVAGAPARPAVAGGADWITPARDRYEPGQTVVMIGYGTADDAVLAERRPYMTYLLVDPLTPEVASGPSPYPRPGDVPLAPVVIEPVTLPPPPTSRPWWTHRASITFDLPADVEPGVYELMVCGVSCDDTAWMGTFWPDVVHVGVDPEYPVVRNWPLTEPGIRWLEDDARIMTPWGQEVTAADVRAGRVVSPPDDAGDAAVEPVLPPAPASQSESATTTTAASAVAPVGRTASPRAAGPEATTPAPEPAGDGGALAWWVVGEVLALVLGVAAWRYWSERRRRRALAEVGPHGEPSPGWVTRLDDLSDLDDVPAHDGAKGSHRESVRIRL
jgi:hypothetical protein